MIIALSFGYVPFLQSGMIAFYLRLAAVAVIPLFTVTMMGALTRVHRGSGVVGLIVGMLYGLSSLLGDMLGWPLPVWWTNTWWAYLWSVLLCSGTMVVFSIARGWASDEEVRGLVFRGDVDVADVSPVARLAAGEGTWLESTREQLGDMPKYPFTVGPGGLAWYQRPAVMAGAFLLTTGTICLWVLW